MNIRFPICTMSRWWKEISVPSQAGFNIFICILGTIPFVKKMLVPEKCSQITKLELSIFFSLWHPWLFKNNNFIYFCLCCVFVAAQVFLLTAASCGYSPLAMHGLLIAVASRAVVPVLSSCGSRALWSPGSVVVALGLNCSSACGNLPRPGIEPTLSGWAGGFFTTEPPEKSNNPWLLID